MSSASPNQLLQEIGEAFSSVPAACSITLRQGNQLDDHEIPDPDPASDRHDWRAVPDGYLEEYHWGVNHLDPESGLFYLPALLTYAVRHYQDAGSLVVFACWQSLRPPDREPSRFKKLNQRQRIVVTRVLESLALNDLSGVQEDASQVLQEYWIPESLYGGPDWP